MEPRNPYAAPKAPLSTEDLPKPLPSEADVMEYGGFWRRVGAALLDALILSPMAIALMISTRYTHLAYVYYVLPSIAISLIYRVYLVQRFGGTPGKRILSMRISNLDGTPVTLRTAFIRHSPLLVLTCLSTFAAALASLNLGTAGLEGMSYMERMVALNAHMPAWNTPVLWATQAWYIISAIMVAATSRKRALHDYLAGTVVLRD